MNQTSVAKRTTKSSLLLKDGLVFVALCGVTVALFGVTLFLFRSFEDHREDLGARWAKRGQVALQQGNPAQAVAALRTALSYRSNDLTTQLRLAQALADAGKTDEAVNYFLTLRETRPGDGFINLQLARLARKQGDAREAVNYYRGSIVGDWEGDGALRRRQVRLELADYLAQRGDKAGARDELLITAGNAPETESNDVLVADRMHAIGDETDAFAFYDRALGKAPQDIHLLAKVGHVAYGLGFYDKASTYLTSALERRGQGQLDAKQRTELTEEANNARRIPELSMSQQLPLTERSQHILLDSGIARRRLALCAGLNPPASGATQPVANTGADNASPITLQGRWNALRHQLNQRTLERDGVLDDQVVQLINDTEMQTAQWCGTPQGDDALLLLTSPVHTHPQTK